MSVSSFQEKLGFDLQTCNSFMNKHRHIPKREKKRKKKKSLDIFKIQEN